MGHDWTIYSHDPPRDEWRCSRCGCFHGFAGLKPSADEKIVVTDRERPEDRGISSQLTCEEMIVREIMKS